MGSTMSGLASLVFCLVPLNPVIEDRVDRIEVNHFYDDSGKLQLDQVIFWEWGGAELGYLVSDWRPLRQAAQRPVPDGRGGFVAVWLDGPTLRRVRSRSVVETFTQYDPERFDRARLPVTQRRGLSRPLVTSAVYKLPPPSDPVERRFDPDR